LPKVLRQQAGVAYVHQIVNPTKESFMKLRLIALAAALAVAGAAQAKIANSRDNGNASSGDLFASLVSVSNTASFTVDLGLRLDQFVSAIGPTQLGIKLVWDLNDSSFTDMSVVSTGLAALIQPLNYGTVFNTFAAPAVIGASDLRFDVKAMDGLPTFLPAAGLNRYLTTSNAPSITANNGQVFAMDNVDIYPNAANLDTTNSTHGDSFATAGANMQDNGDAFNVYFVNGSANNWKGATSFQSPGSIADPLNFFFLTNSSSTAAQQASVTTFAGQWHFDAATAQLSYAAPVPEAETWAMLLAGLGIMGAVVRRRNKRS